MADNFDQFEQSAEQILDNSRGAGAILAEEHKGLLFELSQKAGKYTGLAFKARKEPIAGVVPVGTFFWNSNALNTTTDFTVTFSGKTADLNDPGLVLNKLQEGDIIHFKDYSGRSAYFIFKSVTAGTDSGGAVKYDVVLAGVSENSNYIYQAADDQIAVIEFLTFAVPPKEYEIQFIAPNFVLLENGVPKTTLDLSVTITDTIQASETSLTSFAALNGNYTFQQGDVISIISAPDSILELYIYKGTDKTVEGNYQKIDVSKIDWSNILNKPANLTSVEIQDENGIVQFSVNDFFQFENVVFDSANKKIIIPKSQDIELISSSTGTSNMHGCFLRECGSVFYALRTSGDCDKYALSRPFDLTTKTLVQTVEIANGVGTGLDFKPDGTIVYYSEEGTDDYYQRQLTTPWDLSTAQAIETYSQPAGEVLSIKWNKDGNKFYTRSRSGLLKGVEIHNVSTPWDITTVTSVEDLSDILTSKFDDFDFGKNGYLLYTIDRNSGLRYYSMATPYDFDTISYHGEVPSNINFFGLAATFTSKYIAITANSNMRIYRNNIY